MVFGLPDSAERVTRRSPHCRGNDLNEVSLFFELRQVLTPFITQLNKRGEISSSQNNKLLTSNLCYRPGWGEFMPFIPLARKLFSPLSIVY